MDRREMHKICLVVIFNHRYEKNVPLLRSMYSSRFDDVVFLMPFSKKTEHDVYPVYDDAYYYHGYIAQAQRWLNKYQCSHYLFIGDDVLLNPALNSSTVLPMIEVGEDDAYIKSVHSLSDMNCKYHNYLTSVAAMRQGACRPYYSELPERAEAVRRFRRHNLQYHPIRYSNMKYFKTTWLSLWDEYIKNMLYPVVRGTYRPLPYPLAYGYSDFLVIPKSALAEFGNICGVFAAMNLFVEIAIPTALVLSAQRIATEKDSGRKGKEFWKKDRREYDAMKMRCKSDVRNLLADYPDNYLYIHPIKLSEWYKP